MRKTTLLTPLFFLLTLIQSAYASSPVNLLDIPQQLALRTGFPLFACQLLVSGIVIFIPILLIGMLAGKSKNTWIAELFVGFIFMSFDIAVGWMPVWILGVICLIVSFAFAEKLARVIIRG